MGDAPGPFAFADPAYVTRLLGDAGWRDVGAEPFLFAYRVGGGDAPLDDAVRYLSRIGPAASALRLHVVGVFNFSPVPITDEIKRQLHVLTFELLYPHLSAQVACFTSLVGMPRFMIPKLNIAQDDVMIINMGQ